MADDGSLDFASPTDVLAAQQAQVQQGIGSASPFQRNSALGTMLGRTLFGNPQLQQANAVQNGLKQGAAGTGVQQDGETDVDYTLRKLKAQRDAIADVSPQLAAQLNTQILTLGQKKFENSRLQAQDTRTQTLFDEGESARKVDAANAVAQNRTYVLTPNPKSPQGYDVKAFNMLDPTQSADFDAASKQPNAQVMNQAQAAQLFKGADVQSLKDASKIAAAGAQLEGPLDPLTKQMAVSDVLADPSHMHNYAPFGKAGQARRDEINAGIAMQMHAAGMDYSQLNAIRAQVKGEAKSIATIVPQFQQIQANEALAHNNGDRLLELVGKVNTSKYPTINSLIQAVNAGKGDADVAEFKSVLTTFQTEAARIISGSPSGGGVLSDSARKELQDVVQGSASPAALSRVINRLFTEFSIRKGALSQVVSNAGQDISALASAQRPTLGGQPQVTGQPSVAAPGAAPAGVKTYDPATGTFH
jgi:hypothetical protein